MSVSASNDWSTNRNNVTAEIVVFAPVEELAMREKVNVLRDTMIILGIQIIFRAMLLLRRLNF